MINQDLAKLCAKVWWHLLSEV